MSDQDRPIYPQYCFDLSPTFNRTCFLRASDLRNLKQPHQFQGQSIFFHRNLPIQFIRLVGVLVECTSYEKFLSLVLDDSTGACLSATLWADEVTRWVEDGEISQSNLTTIYQSNTKWPKILKVGAVVDLKGKVREYNGKVTMKVMKVEQVPDTVREIELWKRRENFRRKVLLDAEWVLSEKKIAEAKAQFMSCQINGKENLSGTSTPSLSKSVDWPSVRKFWPETVDKLERCCLKIQGQNDSVKLKEFINKLTIMVAKEQVKQRASNGSSTRKFSELQVETEMFGDMRQVYSSSMTIQGVQDAVESLRTVSEQVTTKTKREAEARSGFSVTSSHKKPQLDRSERKASIAPHSLEHKPHRPSPFQESLMKAPTQTLSHTYRHISYPPPPSTRPDTPRHSSHPPPSVSFSSSSGCPPARSGDASRLAVFNSVDYDRISWSDMRKYLPNQAFPLWLEYEAMKKDQGMVTKFVGEWSVKLAKVKVKAKRWG